MTKLFDANCKHCNVLFKMPQGSQLVCPNCHTKLEKALAEGPYYIVREPDPDTMTMLVNDMAIKGFRPVLIAVDKSSPYIVLEKQHLNKTIFDEAFIQKPVVPQEKVARKPRAVAKRKTT